MTQIKEILQRTIQDGDDLKMKTLQMKMSLRKTTPIQMTQEQMALTEDDSNEEPAATRAASLCSWWG